MMNRKISDYFPDVLKNVREFKALADSYQSEFDMLWDNQQDILNNCFINEMNEQSISRMERMTDIIPKASQSLEERRRNVIMKNYQHTQCTMYELDKRMKALRGSNGRYTLWVNYDDYTVGAFISSSMQDRYNDIVELFKMMTPANMNINISYKYNSHSSFTGYRHCDLQQYTHLALWNDEQFM